MFIFLGSEYDLPALFSREITREESASLMQPLRGPLEQSSVSITLLRSFFVMASSSMFLEFLLSSSSSSFPLRNLERYLDLPVGSSSSSSPPYLLRLVRLLLESLLYLLSPKALLLVGGELSS